MSLLIDAEVQIVSLQLIKHIMRTALVKTRLTLCFSSLQNNHRQTSIVRARSTHKKRSSDDLDGASDDAHGAWESESPGIRFNRVLHQMREAGIVALMCWCKSCASSHQPTVPALLDANGYPHHYSIGCIESIAVLTQPEFES